MRLLMKIIGAGFVIMTISGFGSIERFFAPNSETWPRWEENDPKSRLRIDHGIWDKILADNVVIANQGSNRVDYGGFSADDRALLDEYIGGLSKTPVSKYHRDEQLAYWINLYNALTIQVILDHFPVESIRDIKISPGLFAIGPWGKALISIENQEISLNDIEHRILRPIWRDPRIHYAVNCASVGCPSLGERAFSAEGNDMDAQLDQAARDYVNDARGVSIINGKVSVSKIYDWFIADFGGTEKTVLNHLLEYADPDLSAQLKAIGKISDEHYDWTINDVKK
jgi:hypothetical protein